MSSAHVDKAALGVRAPRQSPYPERRSGPTGGKRSPARGKVPLGSALVVAAILLVLGGCKRAAKEAPDETPRVELQGFATFPSDVLPDGGGGPAFQALACDGSNLVAVSTVGSTLVDQVPGVVSRRPLGLDDPTSHPPLLAATLAASSVVGVGHGGAIVRRDDGGAAWRPEASPVTTALHAVTATADWVVAVGAGGVILARPNTESPGSWATIASPTREDLFAVSPCDRWPTTRICAVGAHGTLVVSETRPSGLVFHSLPTGTTEALRAVTSPWSIGPAHAVGDRGTIVAIDDHRAHIVPSGTTEDLAAVAASEIERSKLEGSFSAVVAVGRRGTVLVQGRGRNKTSAFKPLRLPTTDDLVAIVASEHMSFFVAPKKGGVYTLSLDADARHSFPPE